MTKTYLEAIETINGKEPPGSGYVWRAFNSTKESGVLTARIAQLIGPLSTLQDRADLLRLAHFSKEFWLDENVFRGDNYSVAEGILDNVLEYGYPANVLIIQLAGVETLLPFLPEFWGSRLKESMPKLLKLEPSIQTTMRIHENPKPPKYLP